MKQRAHQDTIVKLDKKNIEKVLKDYVSYLPQQHARDTRIGFLLSTLGALLGVLFPSVAEPLYSSWFSELALLVFFFAGVLIAFGLYMLWHARDKWKRERDFIDSIMSDLREDEPPIEAIRRRNTKFEEIRRATEVGRSTRHEQS